MSKKVSIVDIAYVVNNHYPKSPDGKQTDCYYMEDAGEVWDEDGHFKCGKDGVYVPIDPTMMVDLRDYDFHFAWQGKGPEQPARPDNFAALFRKVMTAKTSVRVVVEIPKDDLKTFEIMIKNMGKGYRVVKD